MRALNLWYLTLSFHPKKPGLNLVTNEMIQKDDLEQTPKSWCPESETLTNGRNNEKAINVPALYNAIKQNGKLSKNML